MNAAEQYTARADAVGEQRTRVLHVDPQYRDRWTGALAKRFRVDPRRELDPVLTFIVEHVRPDDVFLDVGGGAGRVALPVALRCSEAIIVDPSEGMHHEFDELVADNEATLDPNKRVQDWKDIQKLLYADPPVFFVEQRSSWVFSAPGVRDFHFVNDGLPLLDRFWLKTH